MAVFPCSMFLLQPFHWVHMMHPGSRHFERFPMWNLKPQYRWSADSQSQNNGGESFVVLRQKSVYFFLSEIAMLLHSRRFTHCPCASDAEGMLELSCSPRWPGKADNFCLYRYAHKSLSITIFPFQLRGTSIFFICIWKNLISNTLTFSYRILALNVKNTWRILNVML